MVHLAWEAGEHATVWEDGLIAAADHLIEKQFRADNVWYRPNPAKVQGAYRMGLVDNHCRIDNNQHAVVGLHRALEASRRRDGVEMPTDQVLPEPPSAGEIRDCRQRFGDPVAPADEAGADPGTAAESSGGDGE